MSLSSSTATEHEARRIFIDATYTLCSGRNSGIERVVRSLLRECETIEDRRLRSVFELVVCCDGHFYPVSEPYRNRFQRLSGSRSDTVASLPKISRALAKSACFAVPSRKLKKWFLPAPGHVGVYKGWHSSVERALFRDICRTTSPVQAQPGDLLILPDAYWVGKLRSSIWPAARKMRLGQAKIATVIYDLIPRTHPHFVGPKRCEVFQGYLDQAVSNSDLLMAISETVQRELDNYLAEHDWSTNPGGLPQTASFPLGADLSVAKGQVRAEIHSLFDSEPTPYLTVAAFDPRKNHHYLLDAFERWWGTGSARTLCLVGRMGSKCCEIHRRVTQHPEFGQKLFLFQDLSDAELHHAYGRARGVIFPSLVEGYGLPIAESLWFGNRTFASDIPVHREVGKDACTYFDLADPSHLVCHLADWEQALSEVAAGMNIREQNQSPGVPQPVSWSESCRHFLNTCFQRLKVAPPTAQSHFAGAETRPETLNEAA